MQTDISSTTRVFPRTKLKSFHLNTLPLQTVQHFVNNAVGTKIMPCYSLVQDEKSKCHPDYTVTEEGDRASCELQALLNHTGKRVFEIPDMKNKVAGLKKEGQMLEVTAEVKAGLDGTGGLTQFNQAGSKLNKDSHAVTAMISLIQIWTVIDGQNQPIYDNPFVNSYCGQRPLKIIIDKESKGMYVLYTMVVMFSI